MNPNYPLHPRLSGTGYVPYFYQRGLHYLYLTPEHARTRTTYDSVPEAPLFVPDAHIRRALDHPQTVEQIIARGYLAAPQAEPEFAILHDKAQTSWLGLDDVISQIRKRYEIHDRCLYQIDLSVSAARNAIYQHEAYRGPGSADSKQHYAKHKAIQGLYEEKRLEQVSLWKDVSRLRMLLPENAQAYLGASRKLTILNSEPGDAP